MEKNYNVIEIPFDHDEFNSYEEYWDTISELIKLLVRLKYQIKVDNDGYTTSLQFNFSDPIFGDSRLIWYDEEDEVILTNEEYEELSNPINDDEIKERTNIEISEFYSKKLDNYLQSKGIDLLSFYMAEITDYNKDFKDLEIEEFLELVEDYKQQGFINPKDFKFDTKDRMIEENEQH